MMLLNALTIDVEDYFQVTGFAGRVNPASWDSWELRVETSTQRILDCLAKSETRATFFVLGWIAKRRPRLVRAIANAGHEIASHGTWHQLVTAQSPPQFRADIRESKAILEETFGREVSAYRAPSFSIAPDRKWAFEILAEEGFKIDSSVAVGRRASCGHVAVTGVPFELKTSAGSLWEYPLPALRVLGRHIPVGGGGFFRLWPYGFTRAALGRINAAGRPFAVYLHPWEFDPDQPQISVPWSRRFKHYFNLSRTEPRFRRLLLDFRFGTLSESLREFAGMSSRRTHPVPNS